YARKLDPHARKRVVCSLQLLVGFAELRLRHIEAVARSFVLDFGLFNLLFELHPPRSKTIRRFSDAPELLAGFLLSLLEGRQLHLGAIASALPAQCVALQLRHSAVTHASSS